MRISAAHTAAIAAIALVSLAGCSTTSAAESTAGTKLSLVASTDVWGDIAAKIAGNRVAVTSIITSPSQDPHSYQGDAQVQLALSKADVVVQNGGGYDDFVGTMLAAASNPKVKLLDAVKISRVGDDPTIDGLNEHVWYDVSAVRKVAAKLTATLSALDGEHASEFAANEKTFDRALDRLAATESSIKTSAKGYGVAITEPVPLYMLEACGLIDKTPIAFSKAIEDDTDVAPLVLQQTLTLFSRHTVRVLAYNEQTSGPETQQVITAAKTAGIPAIPFAETLPAHSHYLAWMTDNLATLKSALK